MTLIYRLVSKKTTSMRAVLIGSRPHFDPVWGSMLSHDILDHTLIPHPNPFVDELLAIGSIVSRLGDRGVMFPVMAGVEMLGEGVCSLPVNNTPCPCDDLEDKVAEAARWGMDRAGVSGDYVMGWIWEGYNLHRQRFSTNPQPLYDRITHIFEEWLGGVREEGETLDLIIDQGGRGVSLRGA